MPYIKPDLTTANILSRKTSEDIFCRYCENFTKIGKFFSDRSDDNNASCKIDYVGGDLMYKDFGSIKKGMRAIQYVADKYNLQYWEALSLINQDFKLGLWGSDVEVTPTNSKAENFKKQAKHRTKSDTIIKVRYRDYNLQDLKYWGQYYWTLEMLKSADIYPIDYFWLDNDKNDFRRFKSEKYTYTMDYYIHKGVFRRKIYRPFNPQMKFISNVDDTVVQGYKRLSKSGKILVITSSLKDCGVPWRLGIDAIAPNSETSFIPEGFLKKQLLRFDRVLIWFDNDWNKKENSGVINAKKFSEIYNIPFYHNPDNTPKDPSDYAQKYGLFQFMQYFYDTINYGQ